MPELPEVETTRRGIAAIITGHSLLKFVVHEPRLRWPIPAHLAATLQGHRVLECTRRGKYLLLHFEHGTQLIHLGMSGSLRRSSQDEVQRRHDHVEWVFEHATLRLHDPRRFGAVLWHPTQAGPLEHHPRLAKLGIEPFASHFDGAWLYAHCRNRNTSIKQLLLAGTTVVGVGNIYASESLFLARIHPDTAAHRLSRTRCHALALAIRQTLTTALAAGGSTLRDYVSSEGAPGSYFNLHAAVYNRAGLPCRLCNTLIQRIVQNQRATYYCKRCQRLS